jgi:hypothetical protein
VISTSLGYVPLVKQVCSGITDQDPAQSKIFWAENAEFSFRVPFLVEYQFDLILKTYPIHVIDLTARLGVHAMELLGVRAASDSGYWHELHTNQFPKFCAVNWQRVTLTDTLQPLQPNTAGVALLVGPGSATKLLSVLDWLPSNGPPIWIFTSPIAIVEEGILKATIDRTSNRILYHLPNSDPKTLWLVLMEQVVKTIEAAIACDPEFLLDEREPNMTANLKQSMEQAMTIDGAMAAALVDHRSGMCLAKAGTAINLELAAAGNTQVVRAKLSTVEQLGLRRGIEDILITLTDQYHLIRLVPNHQGLFLYLVLDKAKGNLALARYKLTEIERNIKL